MRAYILLPIFVLVIASAGYWATKHDTPVAGKDNVTASAAIKAVGLKQDTHTPNASTQPPLPQQADVKDAQVYDMNNPAEKEKMAASLRDEGIPEGEIQRILKPFAREASPPIEANVAEAESYDMNNPAEKEKMAASLKAEGVPEEDIQQILRHSATEPQFPTSD
jgi:hypothetical protein